MTEREKQNRTTTRLVLVLVLDWVEKKKKRKKETSSNFIPSPNNTITTPTQHNKVNNIISNKKNLKT
jgi:hypothetical protein